MSTPTDKPMNDVDDQLRMFASNNRVLPGRRDKSIAPTSLSMGRFS
jgi:hypothetical protein